MPILPAIKCIFLFLSLLLGTFNYAQTAEDLVQVSILAEAEKIGREDNFWLLLEVDVKPEWHIYWKTAGETGYPTTIKWNLPQGVKLGNVLFPAPLLYEYNEMVSYILKDKVYLLCEFSLLSNFEFPNNKISISGQFSSLVCSLENCIPYDRDFSFDVSLGKKQFWMKNSKMFFELPVSN